VHQGAVPNGNPVANFGGGSLVGTMNNGSILNINLIADTDGVHIATNNCMKPYTAIVSHYHIAKYNCIFS
jgi:butyrate kinase